MSEMCPRCNSFSGSVTHRSYIVLWFFFVKKSVKVRFFFGRHPLRAPYPVPLDSSECFSSAHRAICQSMLLVRMDVRSQRTLSHFPPNAAQPAHLNSVRWWLCWKSDVHFPAAHFRLIRDGINRCVFDKIRLFGGIVECVAGFRYSCVVFIAVGAIKCAYVNRFRCSSWAPVVSGQLRFESRSRCGITQVLGIFVGGKRPLVCLWTATQQVDRKLNAFKSVSKWWAKNRVNEMESGFTAGPCEKNVDLVLFATEPELCWKLPSLK